MISIIKLKKCVVNASIFGIIIGKLHYKKKPCLIILLKIDKSLEIDFHCIILALSLAVYLQVEDNRKSLLNTGEIV